MVSILFVREDSVYKQLGVDCWDAQRDATKWPGGNPIIAHPPCRAWGRLAKFANPRPGERELAIKSVYLIRQFGGVLEHPYGSLLWSEMDLPKPGIKDTFGSYTLCVNQSWWGHKEQKKTLLYVVGCNYENLPPIPISFDVVQFVVRPSRNALGRKIITKKEREATPIDFAKWLIKVADKCQIKLMHHAKK